MDLELVPIGTLTIRSTTPTFLPGAPFGNRILGVADSCRLEGDRIRAEQTGAAASDWMLVSPEGLATMDARMSLLTDDGAVVLLTYTGRADFSGNAAPDIYIAARFETNDERYAWLNRAQVVGKGARVGDDIVHPALRAALTPGRLCSRFPVRFRF